MPEFIMMPIPTDKFTAVCALLGGGSVGAMARSLSGGDGSAMPVRGSTQAVVEADEIPGVKSKTGETIASGADAGEAVEIDAAGWPWDESLHASTKGTTKDGLWRMKVGVSRPDPKPGFPKDAAASIGGTGTTNSGTVPNAGATAATAPAGEDEDEFATFRAAADKASGNDAAAASSVPARKWTDTDLGALCNQAAVKFGDPAPVKALIAEFVPTGEVPHSRNIPDAERENFAQAVELKAGIEFAG